MQHRAWCPETAPVCGEPNFSKACQTQPGSSWHFLFSHHRAMQVRPTQGGLPQWSNSFLLIRIPFGNLIKNNSCPASSNACTYERWKSFEKGGRQRNCEAMCSAQVRSFTRGTSWHSTLYGLQPPLGRLVGSNSQVTCFVAQCVSWCWRSRRGDRGWYWNTCGPGWN